jgi:mono/diheme cytochrome c family protein
MNIERPFFSLARLPLSRKNNPIPPLPPSCPPGPRALAMMNRSCVVVLFLAASGASAAEPPTFESHIRPLLRAHCFDCHGEGEKLRGSLDLRLARLIRQGGDSGPAIVPGKPADSVLYQKLREGVMPPGKKKLTAEQVALIGRWIETGARVEKAEPQSLAAGMQITGEDRAWWAFQPVQRPALPALTQPGSPARNPIDAFLLAKLAEKGLTFAPEADPRTLIRRLSLDLIGLPPTPEETDAFCQSAIRNPDRERPAFPSAAHRGRAEAAIEDAVDRLLADPRYGERWGRHWLDVAGYADSEGYAPQDLVRATAWKYRDYVIRSFNADKPFDRFLVEQIAGDELVRPPYSELKPDDLDRLIATGFLRTAPDGTSAPGVDPKLARNQVLADTVKIVSSTVLGLTVGCAQCHNHRYDPIPQTDYYRLRAILEPALDVQNWRTPPAREVSLLTNTDRQKAKEIEAEAAKIDQERLKKQQEYIDATFERELIKLPEAMREPVRKAFTTPDAKRTAEQKTLLRDHPSTNVSAGSLYLYDSKAAAELKKMADEAAAVRARKPAEEFVRALTEIPGQVPVTRLFHRGDPDQPRDVIAPGGLTILAERFPMQIAKDAALPTTGRRLAFARWLTDGQHPLTARVLVNRVWMHHFGRGLVATPGDFGKLGERPTHPELLDWLAAEFVESGWSLKHLHRLIVTSAAYRQSSLREPAKDRIDPDNRLLGRMRLRRLEAEVIRDSILAASGKLTPRLFGPPVPVKENEVGQFVLGLDNKDGAGRFTAEIPLPPGDEFRRSLYAQVRRSRPLGVLDTFDWATTEPNCEARTSSTVTPQALLLMNGDFILSQSQAFAERLRHEAGPELKAQVIRAWRLAFGVEPTEKDLRDALAFLTETTAVFKAAPAPKGPPPEMRALATFCQALLSANRFLYVE